MKIEIDLDDLGFSYDENGDHGRNRTIQEAIVAAAANQIVGSVGWEYRTELSAIVRDQAKAAVAERLELALKSNIQRTTEWGEPVGGPVTLLDIVREELGKFTQGTKIRDRYEVRNGGAANLAELVHHVVADIIRDELAPEIRQVKREVVDGLRTKALQGAADALVSGK